MNQLRSVASAILAKVDALLTSEPARLIGYGAAVVVVLTVKAVEFFKPGLLPQVSFDEALGVVFSAIATLVILVESIRRFVYSPQTYIEDLSDESEAAYEAAHLEEEFNRFLERINAEAQAADAAGASRPTITVGTAKAANTSGKPD